MEERLDSGESKLVTATFRQKMWNSFENPHSSSVALVFYYVTGFFIAISVLCNIIETVPCETRPSPRLHAPAETITCGDLYEEQVCACVRVCAGTRAVFCRRHGVRDTVHNRILLTVVRGARTMQVHTVNYVRHRRSGNSAVLCRPVPTGQQGLVGRVHNTSSVSRLPYIQVLQTFTGGSADRCAHGSCLFQGLRILGYTLKSCASELGFLVFSLAMAIIIFATIIYYCEKKVINTTFTSIPAAFWYTIVTMTTLG
jgi:potassium voltage-gated channel Shal-related subfamily D protein